MKGLMSEEQERKHQEINENAITERPKTTEITDGISGQRLNLIIAFCAIFISAASFYATYLQANAAERQVKAMTLPLIQFATGNWDIEKNQRAIIFNLQNAGIGPAIIKTASFKYKEQRFSKPRDFLKACCSDSYNRYNEVKAIKREQGILMDGKLITIGLQNNMFIGQSTTNVLTLSIGEDTNTLLNKLEAERGYLSLEICYCSLLDKCYITEETGVYEQVEHCPIISEENKNQVKKPLKV
jgi:hypothetical protein